MTIQTIIDPIYNVRIHFIFHEDNKIVLSIVKDRFDYYCDHHLEKQGFALHDNPEYLICLPKNKKSWDIATILAHECLHVTSGVLRSKGLELSNESEEAFTYHHSWLLQEAINIYFKRGKYKMKSKKVATKADLKKAMAKDKIEDKKMVKKAIAKVKK